MTCTIGYGMSSITPPTRAYYTFMGYYTSTGGGGTVPFYLVGALLTLASVGALDILRRRRRRVRVVPD